MEDVTFHRKPLPQSSIAFDSEEGTSLLTRSLANNSARSALRLLSVFQTQQEPAFCALASVATALNALAIDPKRTWKGVWRWFSEELLRCCIPLQVVAEQGVALDEAACLAACNGAEAKVIRPPPELWLPSEAGIAAASVEGEAFNAYVDQLKATLHECCDGKSGDPVNDILLACYDRLALDQTGGGHFSPIGAVDWTTEKVLILDVARFKLPPHWVSIRSLAAATLSTDHSSHKSRGFMVVSRPVQPVEDMPALRFDQLLQALQGIKKEWQRTAPSLRSSNEEYILASAASLFSQEREQSADAFSALFRPFEVCCGGQARCGSRMVGDLLEAADRCRPPQMPKMIWILMLLARDAIIQPFQSNPELVAALSARLSVPETEVALSSEIDRLRTLFLFTETT